MSKAHIYRRFQMSIKRPTSRGQTHNQEARTLHLERNSFFYFQR